MASVGRVLGVLVRGTLAVPVVAVFAFAWAVAAVVAGAVVLVWPRAG